MYEDVRMERTFDGEIHANATGSVPIKDINKNHLILLDTCGRQDRFRMSLEPIDGRLLLILDGCNRGEYLLLACVPTFARLNLNLRWQIALRALSIRSSKWSCSSERRQLKPECCVIWNR